MGKPGENEVGCRKVIKKKYKFFFFLRVKIDFSTGVEKSLRKMKIIKIADYFIEGKRRKGRKFGGGIGGGAMAKQGRENRRAMETLCRFNLLAKKEIFSF